MKVNGVEVVFTSSMTLMDLIKKSGYQEDRIAAEVNGRIVPRSEYPGTYLREDDRIEIVGFVGGG